jgi:hypothetical protein
LLVTREKGVVGSSGPHLGHVADQPVTGNHRPHGAKAPDHTKLRTISQATRKTMGTQIG